jgi:iron complex transport system ATP-binding protein
MSLAIEATGLTQGYAGARPVFEALDLDVAEGELVALAGPNGAGKSTLLRTVLGILPPLGGGVRLFGRAIAGLSRRDIARLAAFVPQGFATDFDLEVRELVAMGRTPHLGRFRPEGPEDQRAVEAALEATGLTALAHRPFPELSGGERQRVVLARAFAQGGKLLVLDEPTANLDLAHAYQLMSLVRRRVDDGGAALVALHDLALAARFADRLILLRDGRVGADGPPREVLTPARMRDVFHVDAAVLTDGDDIALSVRGPVDDAASDP